MSKYLKHDTIDTTIAQIRLESKVAAYACPFMSTAQFIMRRSKYYACNTGRTMAT